MDKLPGEILANIFSYLPGRDLAKVGEVCTTFYKASRDRLIWQNKCNREFNISIATLKDLPLQVIYANIFSRYGYLLGLWQPRIGSYGGLLQVTFTEGKLLGQHLIPPIQQKLNDPLVRKPCFEIVVKDNSSQCFCYSENDTLHSCGIKKIGENEFYFTCQEPTAHEQKFLRWILHRARPYHVDDFGMTEAMEVSLLKYRKMRQLNFSYPYVRVQYPKEIPKVPIQPGLFKGTYSSHGTELIMLTYSDDRKEAIATKISGDVNVPAEQTTFRAFITQPVVLNKFQQTNIEEVENYSPPVLEDVPQVFHTQPFYLPNEFQERYYPAPNKCTARFAAKGQIAEIGFVEHEFIHAHWVVFNEDLFGCIFFALHSLTMYKRVKDL